LSLTRNSSTRTGTRVLEDLYEEKQQKMDCHTNGRRIRATLAETPDFLPERMNGENEDTS
jgi:hypothetical protein